MFAISRLPFSRTRVGSVQEKRQMREKFRIVGGFWNWWRTKQINGNVSLTVLFLFVFIQNNFKAISFLEKIIYSKFFKLSTSFVFEA